MTNTSFFFLGKDKKKALFDKRTPNNYEKAHASYFFRTLL